MQLPCRDRYAKSDPRPSYDCDLTTPPHATLSLCTSDVIVDRRSFVSRGHPSTTQLYTSGWTCMKWTGGRATMASGGEGWTHIRGKQKHSFSSAYRTLPLQHTHYQCGIETTSQTTRIPFSFPLRPISPTLPSPPHLAFPYLTHTPHSPHNPLSACQRTPHHFSQSQLEAPVSSKHQEPGRLQEGERERGRRGERGEFRSHCL